MWIRNVFWVFFDYKDKTVLQLFSLYDKIPISDNIVFILNLSLDVCQVVIVKPVILTAINSGALRDHGSWTRLGDHLTLGLQAHYTNLVKKEINEIKKPFSGEN